MIFHGATLADRWVDPECVRLFYGELVLPLPFVAGGRIVVSQDVVLEAAMVSRLQIMGTPNRQYRLGRHHRPLAKNSVSLSTAGFTYSSMS